MIEPRALPRKVAQRVHRARLMLARRLHAMGMVFRGGSRLALAPDSLPPSSWLVLLPDVESRPPQYALSITRRAGCLPVVTLAMFRTWLDQTCSARTGRCLLSHIAIMVSKWRLDLPAIPTRPRLLTICLAAVIRTISSGHDRHKTKHTPTPQPHTHQTNNTPHRARDRCKPRRARKRFVCSDTLGQLLTDWNPYGLYQAVGE